MSKKTTLAILLGADRGKLNLVPKKQVEIKRLSDIAGEPVVFTLRALTGEEFDDARNMATDGGGKDGFNVGKYQMLALLEGVVDPDLKSKELREMYGAHTPEDLLQRSGLLLPGERANLFTEITELSGFHDGAVEEVKN